MKKQNFWNRAGTFLTGQGFYIALVCCLLAIGLSGWYLWRAFQTASSLAPVSAGAEVTVDAADPSPADAEASLSLSEEEDEADLSAAPAQPPEEKTVDIVGQAVTEEEAPAMTPVEVPEPAEAPAESEPVAPKPQRWQMPVEGEVSMAYSHDELAYNAAMGDWRIHDGVDFSAGFGDEVLAACAGTVSAVEDDLYLGRTVKVDCGEGITVLYGNLAEDCVVDVGDKLEPGNLIGAVGDTAAGESSGVAWLHFAVEKDGESVDPMAYLGTD